MTSREIGNQISVMQTKLGLIRNESMRSDIDRKSLNEINTELRQIEQQIDSVTVFMNESIKEVNHG